MNVSLRETGCLKKSLNGIFFSSCLRIMHIKVVFITTALLCLQWQPRKRCLIDVQAPPAGRESICINSACAVLFRTDGLCRIVSQN